MKETSTKYGFHRKNEENLGWMFACISMYHIMFEVHLFHGMVLKINSQKNPFRRENISNECPYNVLKIHSAGFPWISRIIYNLFIYVYIYINPINYPIRIIPESFHD